MTTLNAIQTTSVGAQPMARFRGQVATTTAETVTPETVTLAEEKSPGYGAELGTAALFSVLGLGYLARRNPKQLADLAKRLPVNELRQQGTRLLHDVGERLPRTLRRFAK